MSLFSDTDIEHSLQSGRIKLDPSNHNLIQPSSIDVRLDGAFLVWDELDRFTPIDPREPQRMVPVARGMDVPFRLLPGQFALASTIERLTLAGDVAARLEGKSSLGRLGLLTHATAGFIDPGFSGHVTLELKNLNDERPILLWPGMQIGQLCFFSLRSACVTPYGDDRGSHYQDQSGPTPSRAYEQFAQVKPTAKRPSWMAPAPSISGAPL